MNRDAKTGMQVIASYARKLMVCAGALVGSFVLTSAFAYSAGEAVPQASAKPASVAATRGLSPTQSLYFKRNWGVEVMGVHSVSSGYMLDFRYHIIDPVKAKPLNDMKGKAYVVDEATGTRLAVPALENVGELRTGSDPVAGRTYFMIFGNPGRLVKPGGRVSVVIGNFRVDGLVVN